MKRQRRLFWARLIMGCAMAAIGTTGAAAATHSFGQSPAHAPRAVVIEKNHAFDAVLEGEIVHHAYVIENQGDAPLDILRVRTSCGCTTARPPKSIAPGTSGQIEIRGDTRGYGGQVFNKTITVSTNDPLSPQLYLTLKGPVDIIARIEPSRVDLRGQAGTSLHAQATITPNPAHPFQIVGVATDRSLAGKIDARLKEQKGGYLLTVDNRQTEPGQYRGRVILRTDSARRPELLVYVFGDIKVKGDAF